MAGVAVIYTLSGAGNLKQVLGGVEDALRKAGSEADKFKGIGEKSASLLGGVFGDLSDTVLDLGSEVAGLATSLGGAGGVAVAAAGGIAILTGAAVFAGAATKGWLDGVVTLRKELVEQGKITKDQATNLLGYESASGRLDKALTELQLTLAEELAPAMTDALDFTTGLITEFDELATKLDTVKQGFADVLGFMEKFSGRREAEFFSSMIPGMEDFELYNPMHVPADAPSLGESLIEQGRSRGSGLDFPIYGPTPEDLLGVAQWRIDQAKERQGEWAGTPGGQVLTAMRDNKATPFFDIGESIPELEEAFFGRLFQEWLETPAQKFEAAAEEMAVVVGRVGPTLDQVANGIATGFGALGTGSVSGALGMAGVGDPVTMAVQAVLDVLRNPAVISDLFGDVADIYTNLDGMIEQVLESVLPPLIRSIPELLAGFATLGPEVALALVDSAPELFDALIDALFLLPGAFADAIFGKEGLFQSAAATLNPLNIGKDGGLLDALNPFNDGRKLKDYHIGGMVTETGPANLERGERVLTVEQQRAYSTNFGGIHLHGIQDVRALVERLQSELGPFGFQLSLTPHAG